MPNKEDSELYTLWTRMDQNRGESKLYGPRGQSPILPHGGSGQGQGESKLYGPWEKSPILSHGGSGQEQGRIQAIWP